MLRFQLFLTDQINCSEVLRMLIYLMIANGIIQNLLKCLEASWANRVDPDKTAPTGSTLFASTLTLVRQLSKYMQQKT